MNKIILTSQAVFDAVKSTLSGAAARVSCLVHGKSYHRDHGPQWQQLELPFSRTPVKRWNR